MRGEEPPGRMKSERARTWSTWGKERQPVQPAEQGVYKVGDGEERQAGKERGFFSRCSRSEWIRGMVSVGHRRSSSPNSLALSIPHTTLLSSLCFSSPTDVMYLSP